MIFITEFKIKTPWLIITSLFSFRVSPNHASLLLKSVPWPPITQYEAGIWTPFRICTSSPLQPGPFFPVPPNSSHMVSLPITFSSTLWLCSLQHSPVSAWNASLSSLNYPTCTTKPRLSQLLCEGCLELPHRKSPSLWVPSRPIHPSSIAEFVGNYWVYGGGLVNRISPLISEFLEGRHSVLRLTRSG